MTNEESQNLATVERARQRWNAGDLGGYLAMYDPSIVLHGYAGVGPGFAQVKAFYEGVLAAFSASTLTFEDTYAAGDRWSQADFLGLLGQIGALPAPGEVQ